MQAGSAAKHLTTMQRDIAGWYSAYNKYIKTCEQEQYDFMEKRTSG